MTKIGNPVRVWELPAPQTVPSPVREPVTVPAIPEPAKQLKQ